MGEQPNFKLFQISNYEKEFHKIYINREREIIVQPLKGCVSLRGATFLGEILTLLKECHKKPLVKMSGFMCMVLIVGNFKGNLGIIICPKIMG